MEADGRRIAPQVMALCDRMRSRRQFLVRATVRRDRLSLDRVPGAKALLYRAPMGYGKSVLVATAAEDACAKNEAFAYLCLPQESLIGLPEEELLAAVILYQIEGPRALRSEADTASFTRPLRDALAGAAGPVTICLDGPGGDAQSLELIQNLICETPDHVRLVLAAKAADGLVRLSLLPGVRTFGAAELAFTEDEARAFAGMDGPAAKEMIATTGGWPALCGFMRITARPDTPAATWPETCSYFSEELLARLPGTSGSVLRNAAMLKTITAECYDYVFKTKDAARDIVDLSQTHGLLILSGAPDLGMEMHQALRAYLRRRFDIEQSARRSYVLKRIAFWHWRRREFQHAIAAALEARDHRWAQGMSGEIMLDLALRQGEIEALRTWYAEVPRSKLHQLPALRLSYAWTMYFCQKFAEAEDILGAQVKAGSGEPAGVEDGKGWRELVLAIGKATHDEMELSEGLCRDWIREFGDRNEVGKGAALTCLAFIAASDRRFDRHETVLGKAFAANRSARQRYAFGWLAAARIQASLFKGDIPLAFDSLSDARNSPDVAVSHSAFSDKLFGAFEMQALQEANPDFVSEALAGAAFEFGLNYGVTDVFWGVTSSYTTLLCRQGNPERAWALLEQCRAAARERHLLRLDILARLQQAELALRYGDRSDRLALPDESALRFLPNQNRAIQGRIAFLRTMEAFAGGRFGLAERNAKLAAQAAASISDARGEIVAQYCQAVAAHALGSEKTAKRKLIQAEQIARHMRCHSTSRWIRDGLIALHPVAQDLFDAIPQPPLLAARTEIQPAGESKRRRGSLAAGGTRLSVKQIAVLECVSTGMTNKQIASQMLVTEDAVKWHLKKIFGDLDVANRSQAIAAARSRGLL